MLPPPDQGSSCDLLTGDEWLFASGQEGKPAPRLSCTVEMASLDRICEWTLSIQLHYPPKNCSKYIIKEYIFKKTAIKSNKLGFIQPLHTLLDDVAVIDEIQMIEDPQRGGGWTRALLGLPAREVHLCGHDCAVDLVQKLARSMGEKLEVSVTVCGRIKLSIFYVYTLKVLQLGPENDCRYVSYYIYIAVLSFKVLVCIHFSFIKLWILKTILHCV